MTAGGRAELETTLREVVYTLARLERRAGSVGEHEAATWLAERLTRAGAPAAVEEAEFHGGYAALLLPLGLAGVSAGLAAVAGASRRVAAAVAAGAAGLIADDVSNRRRLWRRVVGRRRTTWNVVGWAGDEAAQDTLVVMAHHDAAPTGVVFDQSFQRFLARRFPGFIARTDTSLPLWWPVVGAPSLVTAGALVGSRRTVAAGTALSILITALAIDVARSPTVPGANDNLSAVAVLVGLAERLRDRRLDGIRVLLVSCGAEEVIQGGVYGFAEGHFPRLDRGRTWFVNLDTVGSPELVLVEGEGPFRMEDYCDPAFRELVATAAAGIDRPLRRGVRLRVSTDGVVPHRAGYPTVTFGSWDPDTKLPSNYHLLSDTPENLRFDTVVRAVEVVEAIAEALTRAPRVAIRPEMPAVP
jgi:hypothetical protein